MGQVFTTASIAPFAILLKSLLDVVRDQASFEVKKGCMSSSAPGASSNEGRSAFRNVQADFMIPCSMLAILFDLTIAHQELGFRTKLTGEDPCMMFPQAQGSPSRAVLEMAPDHIYDIKSPTKLTARGGYQQRSIFRVDRNLSAQTSTNVFLIQARMSSRMLRMSSKCPFSVFGVPFGAFTLWCRCSVASGKKGQKSSSSPQRVTA